MSEPTEKRSAPEFRRTEYAGAALLVVLILTLVAWIVVRNVQGVLRRPADRPLEQPRLNLQVPKQDGS
jgi:hypothetical protein